MPHLSAAYGGDKDQIQSAIAKLGRNRDVTRMLTMFSDPGFIEQIEKDISQWSQASTVEGAYKGAIERNPKFIKAAFHDQYESMMESIGAPMMQAALPVMKQVTEFFTYIGSRPTRSRRRRTRRDVCRARHPLVRARGALCASRHPRLFGRLVFDPASRREFPTLPRSIRAFYPLLSMFHRHRLGERVGASDTARA